VAKPRKHGPGYRIRWTDENSRRRSRTFAEQHAAALALRQQMLAVEEREAGLRPPEREPHTFDAAADYWEKHRAPQKRS
jgi:hypothetical protein